MSTYEITVALSKAAILRFGGAVLLGKVQTQPRRLRSTKEVTLLVDLPDESAESFRITCDPVYFGPAKTARTATPSPVGVEGRAKPKSFEKTNPKRWEEVVRNNDGSYGTTFLQFAERWAVCMEEKMAGGAPLAEVAEAARLEAGTAGITGYMQEAAVSVLIGCWVRGEDLRQWYRTSGAEQGK